MGKMKYEISARAAILLGRESVSKVDGAIMELVKNTYDADSTLCLICFDKPNDAIYILDNGEGMTEDVIKNCWMVIGTDNKKLEILSQNERIKSGEKGIGRFALDRLGEKCEMHTKSHKSADVIRWYNDWSSFEESGKMLQDIEADFDYIQGSLIDFIPYKIIQDIESYCKENKIPNIEFKSGTLFKITKLRDEWNDKEVRKIIDKLEFIAPPYSNEDHNIFIKKAIDQPCELVKNQTTEEYDYKIDALFDGERFAINIFRNEYNLNIIPNEVFEMEEFKKENFRYEDFNKGKIGLELSISELTKSNDPEFISNVKKLGAFEFKYIFMKRSMQIGSKENFFYKEISRNRSSWLDQYGGIKIYRDTFLVRPYGDPTTESFDWLKLDTRQATNPAAVSDTGKSWCVNNKQGQGTLLISRIFNESIIDKSSREGLIENECFAALKTVLTSLIAVFEKDRKYVAIGFKKYNSSKNNNTTTKEEGKNIAAKIINNKKNIDKTISEPIQTEPDLLPPVQTESTLLEPKQIESNLLEPIQAKPDLPPPVQTELTLPEPIQTESNLLVHQEELTTLAQTVKLYEEEVEELMTEIQLLRSLATNGLITSTLGHDLKNLDAHLVTRIQSLQEAMYLNDAELVASHLMALKHEDEFIKSWISVITSQLKKDKRKRSKNDIYLVIQDLINRIKPISEHKKIKIILEGEENVAYKKCFKSDIECIIFNLIINSIEAFSSFEVEERKVKITIDTNKNLIIKYDDNGPGINPMFTEPEEIFVYGSTSKNDKNGESIGTGLGMYIVASTMREYNGQCIINPVNTGFSMDLTF